MSRPRRKKQKQTAKPRKKRRQGRSYPKFASLPNRKSRLKDVSEELMVVQTETEDKINVINQLLPGLLEKLSRIPDPRNPKKVKHTMAVLMAYGIFMFVFQMESRRECNIEMTKPILLENLQALFPDLKDMPHQSTLGRLLETIQVDQIEEAYVALLKELIRKKKFRSLLYNKQYMIAVDGTQKYAMDDCRDDRYLRRHVGDGKNQHYAYVLEAVLVCSNGMVLPLLSVFLENDSELEKIQSREDWKQDCELKAFYRLAARLKKEFPRLAITLVLDGLYANGPVVQLCHKNGWDFIIVLKDKSLRKAWEEFEGLRRLEGDHKGELEMIWKERTQNFTWANGVRDEFGSNNRQSVVFHVVLCEERWIDSGTGQEMTSRHAWISGQRFTKKNVHERCNLIARQRWLHENCILKEKHHGYQYEHIFSYDWDAMVGYHHLMHIGRMINEMILHSVSLTDTVLSLGMQKVIEQFRIAMINTVLDADRLRQVVLSKGQLRLVTEHDWKLAPAG